MGKYLPQRESVFKTVFNRHTANTEGQGLVWERVNELKSVLVTVNDFISAGQGFIILLIQDDIYDHKTQ